MTEPLTMTTSPSQTPALVDKYGRHIDYVRLSVTDRCDFRCVYCMSEKMTFLPRNQILSLEEIYKVAKAFTQLGVNKIRLTGGEPLVRSNILTLVEKIGALPNLDELLLTTALIIWRAASGSPSTRFRAYRCSNALGSVRN